MQAFISNFQRERNVPKSAVFSTWRNVYQLINDYVKMTKGNFSLFVNIRKEFEDDIKAFDTAAKNGIQGIKDYILELKKENFTKSLVENLFAYALGRDVGFADEEEINNIVEQVIEDDYRFKTVIEQIVFSPSFYKSEQSWFNKIAGK